MKVFNRVSRCIRSRGRKRPVNLSFELIEDRVLLATFTVTNNTDGGPGSLRQAIGRSGFAAGWGERAGWLRRLGGGWPSRDSGVIPWDFRPLWLEFFGPHSRKGITMSELSNRMIRDMQLAGLVEGSRREYLRAVRQLAAYYLVSPDQLSERKVEDYLLYVRDDLGVAKGTFAPMFAGLKFFYLNTLGYDWPLFTKKKSAGHAGSGCPTSAATRTAAA